MRRSKNETSLRQAPQRLIEGGRAVGSRALGHMLPDRKPRRSERLAKVAWIAAGTVAVGTAIVMAARRRTEGAPHQEPTTMVDWEQSGHAHPPVGELRDGAQPAMAAPSDTAPETPGH